jgi:hypothetical protein
VRYEVAVRTTVHLYADAAALQVPPPHDEEPFAIRFDGRDFVWHPNAEVDPERGPDVPTITVMTGSSSDYHVEMLAVERFLSALSFRYRGPFTVLSSAGASWPGPFDPAVARAPGTQRFGIAYEAPEEVSVVDDERLRLVLALHREGRSSDSPFYRFLAYWNALEASFDLDSRQLAAFIDGSPKRARGWFRDFETPEEGWAEHLRRSNRDAVAHAVRSSPRATVRDPDEPRDRGRLGRDSGLLANLVLDRVEQRWGRYAVTTTPRRAK